MRKKTVIDLSWLKARSLEMPSGCWHWTKHVNKTSGYGYCTVWGKVMPAHRAAYYAANQKWPNHTRHICDNRICVNPSHLLTGTNAENVADKVDRGRVPSGARHPESTAGGDETARVLELSAHGISGLSIAKMTGIGRATVARIIRGEHWSVRT